jgi:hypothetical protein
VTALFVLTDPVRGRLVAAIADQRSAVDFVHVIKHLVDVRYPHADHIVLVTDNPNASDTPGSTYEAFAPTQGRRPSDKLEIQYAPKRASQLNMPRRLSAF